MNGGQPQEKGTIRSIIEALVGGGRAEAGTRPGDAHKLRMLNKEREAMGEPPLSADQALEMGLLGEMPQR